MSAKYFDQPSDIAQTTNVTILHSSLCNRTDSSFFVAAKPEEASAFVSVGGLRSARQGSREGVYHEDIVLTSARL